jgi:Na+-transporting NADH:ubiquinone oxidoreductase subunit NqrB
LARTLRAACLLVRQAERTLAGDSANRMEYRRVSPVRAYQIAASALHKHRLRVVGVQLGDPRLVQIAILLIFTILGQTVLQFPVTPAQILAAVVTACATDMILAARRGVVLIPASALITGLSLGLLLRPATVAAAQSAIVADTSNLWVYALAGLVAITSKYLIKVGGKHLFNPSNFAVVALAWVFPASVTLTPGQWGTSAVLLFVVANLGLFMMYRVNRYHLVAAFWLSYASFEGILLVMHGQGLSAWLLNITSGSVLLFTFFMITDPRTSPNSAPGRVLYGVLTSGLFFALSLLNLPVPLFTALLLACCLVPLINRRSIGPDPTWLLLTRRGREGNEGLVARL